MPLTFDDQTSYDKFSRCKQEAAMLENEVTKEGFVRFSEHAWHLLDWIERDAAMPQAAKDEVAPWRKTKPIPELCVCQDIANTSKHMEITRYTPETVDASANSGFGIGRFGAGGYGVGEQQISITMSDGTVFDALDVVHAVIRLWSDFFARHGFLDVPGLPKTRLGPLFKE